MATSVVINMSEEPVERNPDDSVAEVGRQQDKLAQSFLGHIQRTFSKKNKKGEPVGTDAEEPEVVRESVLIESLAEEEEIVPAVEDVNPSPFVGEREEKSAVIVKEETERPTALSVVEEAKTPAAIVKIEPPPSPEVDFRRLTLSLEASPALQYQADQTELTPYSLQRLLAKHGLPGAKPPIRERLPKPEKHATLDYQPPAAVSVTQETVNRAEQLPTVSHVVAEEFGLTGESLSANGSPSESENVTPQIRSSLRRTKKTPAHESVGDVAGSVEFEWSEQEESQGNNRRKKRSRFRKIEKKVPKRSFETQTSFLGKPTTKLDVVEWNQRAATRLEQSRVQLVHPHSPENILFSFSPALWDALDGQGSRISQAQQTVLVLHNSGPTAGYVQCLVTCHLDAFSVEVFPKSFVLGAHETRACEVVITPRKGSIGLAALARLRASTSESSLNKALGATIELYSGDEWRRRADDSSGTGLSFISSLRVEVSCIAKYRQIAYVERNQRKPTSAFNESMLLSPPIVTLSSVEDLGKGNQCITLINLISRSRTVHALPSEGLTVSPKCLILAPFSCSTITVGADDTAIHSEEKISHGSVIFQTEDAVQRTLRVVRMHKARVPAIPVVPDWLLTVDTPKTH